MKKLTLTLVALCSLSYAHSQDTNTNLVVNPSFESISSKDENQSSVNDIEAVEAWISPSNGGPKLYTTVGNVIYDEYGSSWNFQARSGKNVAGIYVHGNHAEDTERRDYIQGELNQPLEVGERYDFSFWVHYHCAGANNIGIVFLPQPVKVDRQGVIDLEPATFQEKVVKYGEGETWTQVKGSFTAYRPYRNFIIGNFFSNDETDLEPSFYNHYYAYIDDIEVVRSEVQERALSENNDDEPDDKKDDEKSKWDDNEARLDNEEFVEVEIAEEAFPLDVLDKLYFTVNSAELTEDSRSTIKAIAEALLRFQDTKVLIEGHASSDGPELVNQRLSERRAQKVADLLMDSGVDTKQISIAYHGESQPLVPNDSEENRERNRRVEISIVSE